MNATLLCLSQTDLHYRCLPYGGNCRVSSQPDCATRVQAVVNALGLDHSFHCRAHCKQLGVRGKREVSYWCSDVGSLFNLTLAPKSATKLWDPQLPRQEAPLLGQYIGFMSANLVDQSFNAPMPLCCQSLAMAGIQPPSLTNAMNEV